MFEGLLSMTIPGGTKCLQSLNRSWRWEVKKKAEWIILLSQGHHGGTSDGLHLSAEQQLILFTLKKTPWTTLLTKRCHLSIKQKAKKPENEKKERQMALCRPARFSKAFYTFQGCCMPKKLSVAQEFYEYTMYSEIVIASWLEVHYIQGCVCG